VGRRAAADRCDSGAVRHLPGHSEALPSGGVGELRLLRGAFALVLGDEAVPALRRGGDAGGLVPGRPDLRSLTAYDH
jgi:hypothetical protein